MQAAVAAVAAALVLAGCLTADQQTVVDQVNASRSSSRLTALKADMTAASKAQKWSQHMASTGVLEHTGGGTKLDTTGLTNWCAVGENVGKGPSLDRIHAAFMASPTHKANILGSFDRIGTGVYLKDGTYWVTQIFLRSC